MAIDDPNIRPHLHYFDVLTFAAETPYVPVPAEEFSEALNPHGLSLQSLPSALNHLRSEIGDDVEYPHILVAEMKGRKIHSVTLRAKTFIRDEEGEDEIAIPAEILAQLGNYHRRHKRNPEETAQPLEHPASPTETAPPAIPSQFIRMFAVPTWSHENIIGYRSRLRDEIHSRKNSSTISNQFHHLVKILESNDALGLLDWAEENGVINPKINAQGGHTFYSDAEIQSLLLLLEEQTRELKKS
jgi:hypothetical protein